MRKTISDVVIIDMHGRAKSVLHRFVSKGVRRVPERVTGSKGWLRDA